MRYGRVALVISYVGGNMNKFLALILTSVLVLSIFSITPIYATSVTENGDAGSSLADAQDISSISVTEIIGEITVGFYDYPYYADDWDLDLYKIYINDPAAFSATTLNTYTNFEGFTSPGDRDDTMLFLLDENGYAVCMNDNTPKSGSILPYYESTIPAFDPSKPSTPRPTSPGIYYLAITGYYRLPYDQYNNPIFESGSNVKVLGPSFGSGPVSQWSPPIPWYPGWFNFGEYKIILTGVGPSNQPPVANANGPYSTTENFPIDFDASGSYDPDGDTLEFRWDFDSDGTWDTDWSPFFITSYIRCDDFSGIVTLEVTDGSLSDIDTTSIEVNNLAPIIDVLEAKPESVQCYMEEIEFTGIGKDPGCDELIVEWDFGDGSIETYDFFANFNSVLTHTYDSFGKYTVTLTVNDDDGGVTSKQIEIEIKDTKPPKLIGECVESVNPHGNKIPGEDRDKNTKPKNNKNPDGFYKLDFIAEDNCDPEPQIWIGTVENPMLFIIEPGIVVKFTESYDAEPEIKKIGSTNGQAGAVIWHIILPSDPVISVVDASGNIFSCGGCLVPPPPM